jgi:hypothetical protein
MVGGGAGFFLGGCLQAWGRMQMLSPLMDWWKGMEFTFGFLLGAALGWCAWNMRNDLRQPTSARAVAPPWFPYGALVLVVLAIFKDAMPLRFSYVIAGSVLLALCVVTAELGWQVAVTVTATAFVIDLAGPVGAVVAIPLGAFVRDKPRLRQMFLLLLSGALTVSVLKSLTEPSRPAHWLVEAVFACMTLAVWRMTRRADDPPKPVMSPDVREARTAGASPTE